MLQKTVRKFVRNIQKFVPENSIGFHCLAYHLIGAGTNYPVDLATEVFRKQIQQLQQEFEVASLSEVIARTQNKTLSSTQLVALTFDDAYENFYRNVWPLLHEARIPATLYVPVDFIAKKKSSPIAGDASLEPCSWQQLREMADTGLLSIGSHSCSHPDMRTLDEKSARYEISESRRMLEEQLGVRVTSFCYPKGLWNRRLEQLVREYYESAVVGGGIKSKLTNWNPYRLSRLPLRNDMPQDLNVLLSPDVWLEERIANSIRLLR